MNGRTLFNLTSVSLSQRALGVGEGQQEPLGFFFSSLLLEVLRGSWKGELSATIITLP